MPIVKASSWSITSLLSISPAKRLMVGCVLVLPAVKVTAPCARRNPLAVARTVYGPAGAVRLKVPLALAVAEVTRVLFASYKLTVTGLLASTAPVRVPPEGKGVEVGVEVEFAVGDSTGVDVKVAVSDPVGVEVEGKGNSNHS